jgi:hypothetical protein
MNAQQARLVEQVNGVLADDGGLMTLEDIIALARVGRMQVFHRDDAVVVTELLTFPRGRRVNGILAAGNLRSILEIESEVEAFARREGADAIVTHGRPGWARVGRRTGWSLQSWCYLKHLAPTRTNGTGR